MKPIKRFQMGKYGLTPEFIEQIKGVFKNERMVKISILRSACRNKVEADEIAKKLVAELGGNYKYRLIGYVLTVMRFRKPVEKINA